MAKKKAVKAAAKKDAIPAWKEPYPASVHKVVKKGTDGKPDVTQETVMVRAVPTQDITLNGTLLHAGRAVVVGADFAHAHASALKSPDEE